MRLLLLIMMVLALYAARAQVGEAAGLQLEQLAEEEEENGGEEWMEAMEPLLRHPLPINAATEADLQQLRILDPLQIMHLLQYRRLFGPLLHVNELQAVPGWDPETIRKLLPYITVAVPAQAAFSKLLAAGEQRFITSLGLQVQSEAGYDRSRPDRFAGGKAKLLFRYRFSSGQDLRWGYTGEKDAGEAFSKTVFDHHSFYFFWKRKGWLQTIALGDFTINMGQGLVQWQSLAFKKSSEVLAVRRQSAVVLPYQSSGAFYFSRGLALGAGIKRFTAHVFLSRRALDGNTETDSLGQGSFSSFDVSGLHRTENEKAGRSSVEQVSYGGTLHYDHRNYRVGINGLRHLFSLPMQKSGGVYQQFSINGRAWMNASFDYQATFHNLHFFGELAVDQNGAPAGSHGLLLSLDKTVDLSLLQRHIHKRYQSLYGNAFTEQRLPSNENGLYAGLRLRGPLWRFDAHYDLFRFPWLRFRADAPGAGNEYLVQLSFHPNRESEIIVRYRREEKPSNERADGAAMNTVSSNEKSGFRVHLSLQLTRRFSFRARMETIRYAAEGSLHEQGFLCYAEGNLQSGLRAAIQLRLVHFETGGFNSRIYAWEQDVYGFSIPALYDKGFRFYFNLRYNISRKFSCWFRYGHTVYSNRNKSGTGLNLIQGNTVSDVKIQASYRF